MRASLEVRRKELVDALQTIERLIHPKQRGKLLLRYAEGELLVEVGGVSSAVTASGTWPGIAQVECAAMLRLRAAIPPTVSVPVRVDGDRLFIGLLSVPCTWMQGAVGESRIHAAINMSPLDHLLLPYHYSREEIDRAGMSDIVAVAEQWKEERLREATAALEPLGVPRDAVRSLVEEHLRSRKLSEAQDRPSAPVHPRSRQEGFPLTLPGELDLS
jgi:hypothetical protein